LSTLAPDSPSELNILWHYGYPLGMDSAEVGVLKQTHEICLCSLLKCKHRMTLEPQIILGDFTDEALEGQLANQKLSALLVLTDFTIDPKKKRKQICVLGFQN
ncbi:hypothetical protein CFOL_v3_22810, partial [Cephalotus follicularis]